MKKERSPKKKHVPERTCVACRATRPKRELVRIVRTPAGTVVVDETGKQNGRGAYLCCQSTCWQRALEHGMLNRMLRTTLKPEEIAALETFAASLPPTLDLFSDPVSDPENPEMA